MLHHGLQVARLFLLLRPRQAKGVEDLVERRPELVEGGAGPAGDEGLREVGVADGGEEARQIAVGAVDETDEAVDLVEQEEAGGGGDCRVAPSSRGRVKQQPQGGADQEDAEHDPRAEGAAALDQAAGKTPLLGLRGHVSPCGGVGYLFCERALLRHP